VTKISIKGNRRDFLEKISKVFIGMATLLVAGVYLLVAYPARIRKKKSVHVYACDEIELPVQGVRQFFIDYPLNGKTIRKKIYIVRWESDLFAVSPVCTHLGCLVSWYRPENSFRCPCHNGRYDIYGKVTAGPPPAPLKRFPLKIENESVHVELRI
jgi:cytochrome b6-f complex iron-sulfur subunit